ncbi:MAG: MFS transporter [Acidimicrobiales bacterium]
MSPPAPSSVRGRVASALQARLERIGARARSSPRYRWWVLWVSLSGLLATNLLFTVFVVALPEIARGLHTSLSATTWVVTGPMLAFGVAAPLVGKAGDLFGHRRLFLLGIAAEMTAAMTSALAPNIGILIAARILAGLVGASIGAASMALVMSVFDKHDRVKALGFWSLVGAGGPVIGVAVGGPVIQLFGWRAMFFLQVPLLAISALLAIAVLPERAAGRRTLVWGELDLDWAGAFAIAVCVASFLLALTFLPGRGPTDPLIAGLFALSVAAGGAFWAAERRAAEPILALRHLRKRNVVFPLAAQAFSNFGYLGAFFLTPLLLEEAFGYAHDQSAVGFLSLPRPIVFSALAPFAGYLAVRIGERTSAVIGTSAVVLSMVVFALAGHSGGLALVEVALVLSGIGLGVASPSLSATIANEFAPEELGTAAASQQLMNQVGTVAGIQVMETVQQAAVRAHTSVLASFHRAYLVGGAVALLGVVAAIMSRSTIRAVESVSEYPPPAGGSDAPTVSQPAAAQPAAARPAVSQPAAAQPEAARPAVAQPAVAQPAVAQNTAATTGVVLPTDVA